MCVFRKGHAFELLEQPFLEKKKIWLYRSDDSSDIRVSQVPYKDAIQPGVMMVRRFRTAETKLIHQAWY